MVLKIWVQHDEHFPDSHNSSCNLGSEDNVNVSSNKQK
jgi:hypothetical protein